MPKDKQDFIPLLFAGDINVYSVARAFHEAYGIKPYVFGKYATGPCADTSIMQYAARKGIDEQDTFLSVVVRFASEHANQKILVIGCGDSYV